MGVPGIARLAAAAILTFAVLGARPPCVLACSCAPPSPLAELARQQPDVVVVAGAVGVRVGNSVPFLVERWYHGPAPAGLLSLVPGDIQQADGSVMVNTCGRSYETGQRLLLTGTMTADGLDSSNCLPGARLDTAEGAALVAEAEAAFGAGAAPSPEPTSPTAPSPDAGVPTTEPSPATDGGIAAALPNLAVLGGLGAACVGIALFALRRARREG